MSEEEAIKEIERYLDYDGSVSISAIATLYTSYQKEKEKNALLVNNNGYYDLKDNYISKDEIRKFETDIYRSYDYDMGVSESFIKFLEEKGILERN